MRRLVVPAIFAVACASAAQPPTPDVPSLVPRVVDGDTPHVDVDGLDLTIRLIGIDTPEVDSPFTERECFGRQASRHAAELLDGQAVGLEFDVERLRPFDPPPAP